MQFEREKGGFLMSEKQEEELSEERAEEQTADSEKGGGGNESQDDLPSKIEEMEKEIAEWKDKYLRAHADFENTKKRLEKDKSTAVSYANESFAMDILAVLDSFEQALASIEGADEANASEVLEKMEVTMSDFRQAIKEIEPSALREIYLEVPEVSWDEVGGLEEVKDTLRRMVNAGIWVEVTTLIIPGENDSDSDLTEMAEFIANDLGQHVPWHLSAFFPNYKMMDHEATKLETLERAKKIGQEAGLEYIYLGNVPVHGDTYCPDCNTLLIDRTGYTVTTNMLKEGHCPNCNREIEGIWK